MRRFVSMIGIAGILLSMLAGCYTSQKITIQVLHPPEKIIFNTPEDLVLINRELQDTSLQDTLKFNSLKIPLKMYYELKWKTLYGFADVASSSPWVKKVFFDSVFLDSLHFLLKADSMKFHAREKIMTKNQATVGIDLARIVFNDSIYRKHEFVPVNDEEETIGEWLTVVNVDLYLKANWYVYRKNARHFADSLEHTSMLNLNGAGTSYREAIANLPNVREAISDLAYQAGQNEAYHIFPVWDNVQRIYFVNNVDQRMKEAETLAKQNKWMDAAMIWHEIALSKNRKKASKAAFNMALVSEINDKLDLAESWLKRSLELEDDPITRNYLEIIKERQSEYKKMNLKTSSE